MQPLKQIVTGKCSEAISRAFPALATPTVVAQVIPRVGDYQCNNPHTIAAQFRALGEKPPAPKDIAQAIVDQMDTAMFEKCEAAANGSIVMVISRRWLSQHLKANLFKSSDVLVGAGECPPGTSRVLSKRATKKRSFVPLAAATTAQRVIVDMSSPNIAKEMHVGHLRSTILGESISRVLEYCGNEVHRVNHVGDWGTQFGMLIEYLSQKYPDYAKNMPDISDLVKFYKAAKAAFDLSEDFQERSRHRVVKLQSGDAEARAAWQAICDVSREAFEQVYSRLDATMEERGESYYNAMIPGLIQQLDSRGFVENIDGARVAWTPNVGKELPPLFLQKKDGGFGYDATDVAAVYHRAVVQRADWLIYLTDQGQETHFFMVFDLARRAGWLGGADNPRRTSHAGFGFVTGADGKKFKTRSGDVVKLVDLLDEAVVRAKKELQSRAGADDSEKFASTTKVSDEDMQKTAERLGYAAVKYFDLKTNRTTNYSFNFDKILDAKGDTAVYLFYQYARICQIMAKVVKTGAKRTNKSALERTDAACDVAINDLSVDHDQERALALKLAQFPDVVESAIEELMIHKICEYLYHLTKNFAAFYKDCRVVASEEQESRLALCEATRRVLFSGFYMCGFEPVERI